jgi:hypothetical protein
MTYAPQSAKVKKMLAEELVELGVAFEGTWPLPKPRLKEPPQKSLLVTRSPIRSRFAYATHATLSLEEMRRGTTVTTEGSSKAIAEKWMKTDGKRRAASLPALEVAAAAAAKNSKTQSGGAHSSRSHKAEEKPSTGEQAQHPRTGSANRRRSKGGDDGFKRNASKSAEGGARRNSSSGMDKAAAAKAGGSGWTGGAAAGKAGAADGQDAAKMIGDRMPTDLELHNGVAMLRSSSRLHKSAIDDSYRFGVVSEKSATDGAAMTLRGAGASPTPPGCWASDASVLSKDHNGAMRGINPSKLDPLPIPTKRRKKKAPADEDELQLSASGLFFARYPGSAPLKTLKVMIKSIKPKEEEKVELLPAASVNALKETLAGLKLGGNSFEGV